MKKIFKSSIYVSIFKRKGAEGLNTKIITEENKKDYISLFSKVEENETPLIIYFLNLLNWFLLTNNRILFSNEGTITFVNYSDIVEVHLALREEMNDGIIDKNKFSRLKIKIKNGENFVCKLEQGQSYQGIYQLLHFIAVKNSNK